MTVAAEVEAEIARLFAVEHWKVGTIADQLGVHHDVVRRVLGLLPESPRRERPPLLVAPYEGFVKETLERYPRWEGPITIKVPEKSGSIAPNAWAEICPE